MKKIITVVFIFLFISQLSHSQSVSIYVEDDCEGSSSGILIIELLDVQGFSFPMTGEYLNVETQSYEDLFFYVPTLVLSNLSSSDYEFTIDLSESHVLNFCAFVDNVDIEIEVLQNTCKLGGVLEVEVSGGASPYDFEWSNGATTSLITPISAGDYMLTVSDVNGCTSTKNVTVDGTDFPIAQIDNSCLSSATGRIIYPRPFLEWEGYSYLWENGSTFYALNNATSGTYCVTITSPEGCTKEECNEVEFFPEITIGNIIIQDNCSSSPTGSISFEVYDTDGPWTIEWVGIQNTANQTSQSNLSEGSYTVIITDQSCSQEFDFIVDFDCECYGNNFNVLSAINYPCTHSSDNGQISLQLEDLNFPNQNYAFAWSNGETGSEISGLNPGTYSVTITESVHQCEIIREFILYAYEDNPLGLTLISSDKSCPSEGTGSLTYELTGSPSVVYYNGVSPIVYGTEFVNGNLSIEGWILNSEPLVINNLEPRMHCTYIAEWGGCGITSSQCDEVEAFDFLVEETLNFVCDGTSSIELNIVVENNPYDILWSNGAITQNINNLDFNFYTVSITDSKGCTEVREFNLNPVQIIDQIDACYNMNDGEITISINNPNNDQVSIYYPWAPCADCPSFSLVESYENPTIVVLDQLFGDVDYSFDINIGSCQVPFTYSVNNEPLDRDFVRFEEKEDLVTCFYNIVCKDEVFDVEISEIGNIVPGSGLNCEDLITSGFFGLGEKCPDMEIFCDLVEEPVHVVDVGAIKIRMGELLLYMISLGTYSQEQINFVSKKADPCAYVWTCPGDPFCGFQSIVHNAGFWGGTLQGQSYNSDGCVVFDCDIDWGLFPWSDDFTVCGAEFLPDWLEPYVDDDDFDDDDESGCHLVTKNVAEMSYFLDELVDEWGEDFESSDLYEFLEDFQNDPRRFCSEVSYCANNFSLLTHNLMDVECGENLTIDLTASILPNNLEFHGFCNDFDYQQGENSEDPNILLVHCLTCEAKDITLENFYDCYNLNQLNFNFNHVKNNSNTKEHDSENVKKYINSEFEFLSSFITEYGYTYFDGIYNNYKGQILESGYSGDQQLSDIPSFNYLSQDFRDGSHISIRKDLANKAIYIDHGIFSDINSRYIESSNELDLLSVKQKSSNEILVKVLFNGDLSYDQQVIAKSEIPSLLIMSFDNKGNNTSVTKVEGLKESSIGNNNYTDLYTVSDFNALVVNEIPTALKDYNEGSSLFFSNGRAEFTGFDISKGINAFMEENGKNTFYIFSGSGSVKSKEVDLKLDNSTIVFQKDERNESSPENTLFQGLTITDDKLISSNENSLFIGFNSKEPFISNGNKYLNLGGGAIYIAEISSVRLDFTNEYYYDTEYYEDIKELIYKDGYLNFGGNLSGVYVNEQIGDLYFTKVNNGNSAFVSRILLNQKQKIESRLSSNYSQEYPIKIYPNPTSNQSIVSMSADQGSISSINVSDIHGKLILSSTYYKKQNVSLDCSNLANGVYIIQTRSSKNETFTNKIVISHE